ncbi:MAG: transglutaminase-like domain-containing protein [Planctomycetota bacterium]
MEPRIDPDTSENRPEAGQPKPARAGEPAVAPTRDDAKLDALIALLGDETPGVRDVARDELERAGETALPHLRRAARSADAATRARARSLLLQLDRARARRRMIQYIGQGEIDLESALFLMSRLERPDLDARPYKKALDAFAEAVRRRLDEDPGLLPPMALADYLGGEIGFRGEGENYHHPDRIFLHRTIETRQGMPLTLTAIYLFVARRVGIRAAALPIPGHVLLRVYGTDRPILLDPFRGGEVRTHQECVAYLERHGLAPQPSWFHDAGDALLLQRQLMNLMQSMRLRGLAREARETYKLAALVELQRSRRP